jgi:cohesin complex subunit SA-1/2
MHETEVLYTDEFLMENIARWVATMSSSTLRPFRHTATTVALAMETALVEVAKKLDDRITKLTKQTETEKARRQKANKALLQNIQKDLDEATQNRSICQDQIKDFFDTVFVHRYRDIDSKIRTECVDALGSWIMHLPSVFLEPEYLRYLGWMLSDTVAQTRHEVLKQLARIFKRDADKIGSFIDRFRPRLVEMATRDIDVGVRVVAISVMETLKSTGMLEPTEIDSVCKLIFDSELRVRKAVVDFFADCINDAIEAKIEDMGGNDAIEDIFGDDEEDEYYAPRRDWVNIKCLAESLAAYDTQFEENAPTEPPRPLDIAVDMYNTPVVETRISVAAQVLYEKIAHIRNWEVLAGYLLHDHTVSAKASKKFNKGMALRNAVAPDGREEAIILEMLSSAVKQSLSHNADAHKKKSRTEISESPEDIALKLAGLIPKLLKKFGADPATAKIVLHLSRALDLDVFHQLRQDTQTCTQLLDEICTQFNRHVDRGVIHEASAALQETRQREELAELTDSKISVLWENVINSLRNFDKSGELSMRGDLDAELLNELANVLMKMSKLSSISECIDVLDAEGPTEESSSPAIEILIRVVHRGKIGDTNEELDDPEDEAVAYAIKVCFFYFMWQVRRLKEYIEAGSPIPQAQTDALNNRRKTYQMNLISTLSSRGGTDDLRLFATGALCDLHIIFGNLRSIVSQAPGGDESYQFLDVLYEEIPPNLVQAELIEIFESTERSFANRTKRTLAEPADDEDPIDDDDSDDEDEDELPPDEKKGRELKAEKQLCDLASKYVLAIALGMLDASGPQAGRLRKRMLRNASRLGANFRGVVEFLDEAKLRAKIAAAGEKAPAASGRNRGGKKPAGQQQKGNGNGKGKGKAISEEIIVDDDSSEEGEESQPEDEVEEGTEEDLRRRELLDDPMEEDEEEGPTPVPENVEAEEDSVLGD